MVLGHSKTVQMVFTSVLYILKIFIKCCTYVYYEQCIDKAYKYFFAFHNYHNYFMAFLVIFEISVMISITTFPLIRARPQVYVVLSRSLTII